MNIFYYLNYKTKIQKFISPISPINTILYKVFSILFFAKQDQIQDQNGFGHTKPLIK